MRQQQGDVTTRDRRVWVLLALPLGLLFGLLGACGDSDSDPKSDPDAAVPADDAALDAALDATPDAEVPDDSPDLSTLTNEDGVALCEDEVSAANGVLTDEQRVRATCLLSLYGGGNLPADEDACDDELSACVEGGTPSELFAPLAIDCGALMTEACEPGATVGDFKACVGGFRGLWEAMEPYTTCASLFEPNALARIPAALGPAVASLEAGLADCQLVAAVCGVD